jgi:translation initiation factor 3 subunit L
VYEILSMYESSFAKITEKYFKASSWPPVEAVAPYVDYDHVFCMLYKEMYYRHIFARLTPTLEQRCASWDNYCELFGVILQGNVNMQLPNLWLWEMVDEFIYQFQSFAQYRGKLALKSPEEVEALRGAPQTWNVLGVVNYLQALADTSGVVRILEQERGGEVGFSAKEGYDYHTSNVLRVLGYFSLVGLARVHCLLGDYAGGLRALDPIDLDRPGLFTKVAGAHVTTLYYVGFAYLMARRYTDAIRAFNAALVYIARHKAFHARAAGYEQILKKAEQMYALLAIAVALCPQHKLLEDGVKSALADKYAEKMVKMNGGDEGVYDELFSYACPKFITAAVPDFESDARDGGSHSQEAYRLQLRMFLSEVRASALLPLVRSFLKLYTTIPVAKLAALMDYEEGALRQVLLALKRKATVKEWRGGASALDGVWVPTGDVDFYIDGDMVHVVDSKPQRQYVYELVTAIDKQRELQTLLRRQ